MLTYPQKNYATVEITLRLSIFECYLIMWCLVITYSFLVISIWSNVSRNSDWFSHVLSYHLTFIKMIPANPASTGVFPVTFFPCQQRFFFLLVEVFSCKNFFMCTVVYWYSPVVFVHAKTAYRISSNNSRPSINRLPGIIAPLWQKHLKESPSPRSSRHLPLLLSSPCKVLSS